MNTDPNQLKLILDSLPPSTLEALFNPAADAIGRGVGGLLYGIFSPLIKLGIRKQSEFELLTNGLAEKLNKVPIDRRTDEKQGLLFKTMEDSKYSLDDDMLRDYFENLLVNTVDKDRVDSITPYFSTVLSNMSHEDAEFLAMFKGWEYSSIVELPLVNVKMTQSKNFKGNRNFLESDSFSYWKKDIVIHQTSKNSFKIENPAKSINLLESFGIIERTLASYNSYLDGTFTHYTDGPEMKQLKHAMRTQNPSEQLYDHIQFEKGQIELTELGRLFASNVLDVGQLVIKI